MIPGELLPEPGDIELNAGLSRTTLSVANTGDRPIQVGSHYHFAETNPALSFDRAAARGDRRAERPVVAEEQEALAVIIQPPGGVDARYLNVVGERALPGFAAER